ncbi:MAG: AAA family ATPase [Acidimicrobiia bacterium]|nr:AAA family ATPase [Acidimicrobiia bacterium]
MTSASDIPARRAAEHQTDPPPAADDQADRDAIAADLGSTLFVEASAGSGKTTALVERVLALLDDGTDMENIAAITFTEKAAAELKNRLRQKLSDSKRHQEALDKLDAAAITTLHGFALRILSQHALEAGLPPRIEVSPLDAFEDRWEEMNHYLLHSAEHQDTLALGLIMGISANNLHNLAQALDDDWDLVEERMGRGPVPTEPVGGFDFDALCGQMAHVAELAHRSLNPECKLAARLTEIGNLGHRLSQKESTEEAVRLLFGPLPSFRAGNIGRKGDWPSALPPSDVRARVAALGEAVGETKLQVAAAVIERLARVLGALILDAAENRRRQGVLEFHDLLVLARNLLRHPEHGAGTREALAARYPKLLIDEFQDTDPIQIDLAKLIASPPTDANPWPQLSDEPGRLFFVGDPKQSIYRFRRADIAVFAQAGRSPNVVRKSLTRNFRSAEPIISWVNGLFASLMVSNGDHVQPGYSALKPVRGRPPAGPSVAVLDTEHPKGTEMAKLRQAEADEVAQAVLTAVGQGWSVGADTGDEDQDAWQPARLADICILLPIRTSLPQLEAALQTRGIPYRMEAGSLIWASQAIRDAMSVLRALSDPTDEICLLNALRSPAFGCGDDDLFTFKAAHNGRWDYLAKRPKTLPDNHRVGQAMTWLAAQHAQVRWISPSRLLERIVRKRRLLESGCFGSRRARDVWGDLHWLIDQARQFEATGGRGVREFIAWADRRISERARDTDAIAWETDDDAVRITTVHAAKGREFPIVVLSGTFSRPRPMTANILWPPEGGFGVRFSDSLQTSAFAEHRDSEKEKDLAEQVRLLYVATTRAKDHLVVSAHRMASGKSDPVEETGATRSMAEMVVQCAPALPHWQWVPVPLAETLAADSGAGGTSPLSSWESQRNYAILRGRQPMAVSASAIAAQMLPDDTGRAEQDPAIDDPGLAKDGPVDGDDQRPPWRKGRYGTKVGSAVHGVLQAAGLDIDAALLAPVAAAQAEAEGVASKRAAVLALARSVLSAPSVREAAKAEHRKEVYVASRVGDKVLEGYIDLLYRTPEGLVVVDYKTDDIHDDEMLQAKIDRYRLQLAAYTLAVGQAVGEEVIRCVLVFARQGQDAREVVIAGDELASAQQEVRRRLALAAA